MHLIETYSLLSGAQIKNCFIHTEEYSLPYNKYMLFHADCSKAPARQYKQWHKVLTILQETEGFDLPIIQIGSITDNTYDTSLSLLGQTNTHQLAHIIKHCELLLCYDSLPMHIASHFDKKLVALFSYYAQNSGPYFSSKDNAIVLEPDFSKIKPSHTLDDPYDLINTIRPEIVANSALRLLGIKA